MTSRSLADWQESQRSLALGLTLPSPGSTTLEDVLDSLLGLPSQPTRVPTPQPSPRKATSPFYLIGGKVYTFCTNSISHHMPLKINFEVPINPFTKDFIYIYILYFYQALQNCSTFSKLKSHPIGLANSAVLLHSALTLQSPRYEQLASSGPSSASPASRLLGTPSDGPSSFTDPSPEHDRPGRTDM